jgi:hypothetical protein
MKNKILLIFAAVLLMFGCTKTQVVGSLDVVHSAGKDSVITVISIDDNGIKISECVERKLKSDLHNMKFISGDDFREAVYPWFEPSTAPKNEQELSNLLSKPLVRERIEDLGLEFLIYVSGSTEVHELGGELISTDIGVYGKQSAKRETNIETSIWDIKKGVSLGSTNAHSEGKYGVVGVMILPIPFFTFPQSNACDDTAKRIADYLKGMK